MPVCGDAGNLHRWVKFQERFERGCNDMKTEMGSLTVETLIAYREEDFMKANPEYQRGEVWKPDQQKKLIDSIFRGYQLPIIYLHDIRREVFGKVQERLEVIDGQQRINALHRYFKGEFSLYEVSDERARFPAFIQDTQKHPCPWGGRDFDNLPDEWKNMLLEKELPVAFIRDADDNEVRDLFVRLQAGFPLNEQEKRDSLPGEFTDFILKLGGKPDRVGYPGHQLFTGLMGLKPGTDRGRTRQLAAQIVILFMERRKKSLDYFRDTKRDEINDYYYSQLDFDSHSIECQRLRVILDKLCQLLNGWKRTEIGRAQRHPSGPAAGLSARRLHQVLGRCFLGCSGGILTTPCGSCSEKPEWEFGRAMARCVAGVWGLDTGQLRRWRKYSPASSLLHS